MNRKLIVAALVAALPIIASAQSAAPAAAPNLPADSSGPSGAAKKWEIRGGGFIVSGERSSAFRNSVNTSTGSVKGVEVLLRGSGAGIQVRSSSSAFGNPPDVVNADVSVLLGPPGFSLFVGGAKRALTSTLGTQVYTFARAGLQMTFGIGGTGLRAQIGGWGFVPGPDDKERMDIGGEGEASLLYSPPKLPLFVQLGYRNEVFKTKTPSTVTPEEVRGLRLGAGIQFGGK